VRLDFTCFALVLKRRGGFAAPHPLSHLGVSQDTTGGDDALACFINGFTCLPVVEVAGFVGVVAYLHGSTRLQCLVVLTALHKGAIDKGVDVFATSLENGLTSTFLNPKANIFKLDSDRVPSNKLLVQNAQALGIQIAIDADALGVKVGGQWAFHVV